MRPSEKTTRVSPRSRCAEPTANLLSGNMPIGALRCDSISWAVAPLSNRVYPCPRSEEHTSELQSHLNLVCRLLLEKKKKYMPQRLLPTQLSRSTLCRHLHLQT